MPKSPTSPKASAYFLAESGLLRPDGKPAGRVGAKDRVLLSRGLARYQFVPRAAGLSAGQADKSVLLLAESRTPFPDGDALIQRNVLGYGVWWWDAARVRELMADKGGYDKSRMVPESLVFNVGSGWRQVATYDGFEAQCWRDFTLIASTWRRRPFTHEQWLAFVDSTGEAGADAPPDAPEPMSPGASLKNIQKLAAVEPRKGWASIEGAAMAVTATSAVGALFFLAQGVHFSQMLGEEQAAIEQQRAAAKTVASKTTSGKELAALQTLADDWRRPNPLMVGAAAMKVVKSFGQTPVRWQVQENKLRLETPLGASAPIGEVAGFLERNEYLSNVRPQSDPMTGNAIFVADVCPKMGENGCGELGRAKPGKAGVQPASISAPQPQPQPQYQAPPQVQAQVQPQQTRVPPPQAVDDPGARLPSRPPPAGNADPGLPPGYAGRAVDQSNIPPDVLKSLGLAAPPNTDVKPR